LHHGPFVPGRGGFGGGVSVPGGAIVVIGGGVSVPGGAIVVIGGGFGTVPIFAISSSPSVG
jgi:hypothetical protein